MTNQINFNRRVTSADRPVRTAPQFRGNDRNEGQVDKHQHQPAARAKCSTRRGRQAQRTACTGGNVQLTSFHESPWFSLSHRLPVVVPKASRSPLLSIASAWR